MSCPQSNTQALGFMGLDPHARVRELVVGIAIQLYKQRIVNHTEAMQQIPCWVAQRFEIGEQEFRTLRSDGLSCASVLLGFGGSSSVWCE